MKTMRILTVALLAVTAAGCGGHRGTTIVVRSETPRTVSIDAEVFDPVTDFVWENVNVRIVEAEQEWSGCICRSPYPNAWQLSDVDGLVFFGTTGEEASLTLEERRRTIELVQKRAEGRMFVVAGAFDNVTERAVTLAREMDWLGVDAILSVVPYYTRPNQAGIIEHFRRIADAVDSPVILVTLSPNAFSMARRPAS